jgi:hypothetical protein
MPIGITRSAFTRKFADVLGWKMQTLRNFYNNNGYVAPYDDMDRALRLHKRYDHDINKLLKAMNLRAEQVIWEPPQTGGPPNQPLALTHAPSPPPAPINGTAQLPVPHQGDVSLLARLARATREGDTKENRQRLRETLNNNGFDLRSRNEERALLILRNEGVTFENFVSYRELTPAEGEDRPDIDSMGLVDVRKYAHALVAEIEELRLERMSDNIRLGKVSGMLDISKNRAFRAVRNGRDDFTDAELAALNARAVLKQGHLEDV